MTKKQVEELVVAYRACEKKEQQMRELYDWFDDPEEAKKFVEEAKTA